MRVTVYALVFIALLITAFLSAGFGSQAAIYVYDELRPFVTRYATPFCISRLRERGVSFTQIPDQAAGQCRVLNAVRVSHIKETKLSRSAIMTCGLALNFSDWIEEINRLSLEKLGHKIELVEHAGTYNCRQQRGSKVLSEHAFANGIDIKSFTIGGTEYTVERDWSSPQREMFLREAFSKACWSFGLALGPQNDSAHSDHFHLDNGTSLGLSKMRCIL